MTEISLDGTATEPSGAAPARYAARPAGEAPKSIRIAGRDLAWRQLGAFVFLLVGGILILTGWVGVSQHNEVWQQMPYFVSGGVGGLALVLVGLGLYNAHQHALDQAQVGELCRRLEALELGLGGEFDDVLARLDDLAVGRARVRN
jgi:hypothetical protein